MIVKSQIAFQALLGLADVIIGMQIYLLIFDASPEPFDEHIITPATSTVHAYGDIFFLQKLSELPARELAALVSVEDLGCTIKSECLLNRLYAKIRTQGVGQSPREYPA